LEDFGVCTWVSSVGKVDELEKAFGNKIFSGDDVIAIG